MTDVPAAPRWWFHPRQSRPVTSLAGRPSGATGSDTVGRDAVEREAAGPGGTGGLRAASDVLEHLGARGRVLVRRDRARQPQVVELREALCHRPAPAERVLWLAAGQGVGDRAGAAPAARQRTTVSSVAATSMSTVVGSIPRST